MTDYDDSWAGKDVEIVNGLPVLTRHVKGIINELGQQVRGSFTTVVARLNDIDTRIAGKANTVHNHDASTVFNAGTVPASRLGTGTPNSQKVLDGSGTWVPKSNGVVVLGAVEAIPAGLPANTLIFRLPS